jgi:hypothetical protein
MKKMPCHYVFTLMDITAALRVLQDAVEEIACNTRSPTPPDNIIPLRNSRPPVPQAEPLDIVDDHLHDAILLLVAITGEDYSARADAIEAEMNAD